MKKLFFIFLVFFTAVTLVGCGEAELTTTDEKETINEGNPNLYADDLDQNLINDVLWSSNIDFDSYEGDLIITIVVNYEVTDEMIRQHKDYQEPLTHELRSDILKDIYTEYNTNFINENNLQKFDIHPSMYTPFIWVKISSIDTEYVETVMNELTSIEGMFVFEIEKDLLFSTQPVQDDYPTID
ncbi:hypothetical protein KHQ88_01655 [Mycoplasmatota bacterium]|nr:hypothetical protein KHQ88_01655 [Mycoplasmatota bacterium]